MDLNGIGKAILIFAGVLAVVGLLVLGAAKLNIPLGRLPGDMRFGRGNVRVWFPLGTSILLSIVLTILLNVLVRRR